MSETLCSTYNDFWGSFYVSLESIAVVFAFLKIYAFLLILSVALKNLVEEKLTEKEETPLTDRFRDWGF